MSSRRPPHWDDMSYEDQRAYEKREREMEDAEYEKDRACEDANRKAREASEARRTLETVRVERQNEVAEYEGEIEELREELADTRTERDMLHAALEQIRDMQATDSAISFAAAFLAAQKIALNATSGDAS